MRRLFPVISLGVALFALGPAAAQEYFQQFVHYTIDARLNTDNHMLTGMERILYVNHSPDTLTTFYLHLYPNAFQSKHTALMKDYLKRFNRTFIDLPEKYRSYLDIADVRIDGAEVKPVVTETVAEMKLPAPLAPGDSITVTLVFEEKIRRHLERAGYRNGQYDVSQWYPKVAVYDENGWHADVLRAGEYYGEFGTFDVTLVVPEDYVVAATGELAEGDAGRTLNPPGRPPRKAGDGEVADKTVRFHAERVHDFAWSASPRFAAQDTTREGVRVYSVFDATNREWRDSTLVHGVRAVDFMSEQVGDFPYPEVGIVQALMRGGMEYPMLAMNGKVSESLVVHEIAHNWFYAALANDEQAEAWLDEGFVSYFTNRYLLQRYGEYGSTADWSWYDRVTPQYTLMEKERREVLPLLDYGYKERIAQPAAEFRHDYFNAVYTQAALVLDALRYVVGNETFETSVRRYYEEWKFKHVNEERFQAVCEEVSGLDLDWFFTQWLHTRKICDYRLAEKETARNAEGAYVTRLIIERLGEITIPLLLEFTFEDGTKDTTSVAVGKLRTIEKTYAHAKKPRRVALNPENRILDVNLSDNFLPRRYSLQIDWPNNRYYPEYAYQIRHHPFVWYNDVDGVRAGYVLDGSRYGYHMPTTLGVYYGFDSHRLDFNASARRPFPYFGERTLVTVSGYKLEGRNDVDIELSYRRRPQLSRPPTQRFTAGLNYHELRNERYVEDPFRYQKRSDVAPYFGYQSDPQFDLFASDFRLGLRVGRNWLGGRYKYTRFESSLSLESRREIVPFDARCRFFLGVTEEAAPYQQKFYLAGGGPLEEEKTFFLRSPGAIPEGLNYHQPGHGNLRGYFEGDFGTNSLLALNFELGGAVPILSRGPKTFLGRVEAAAFADLGWNFDSSNPIETSARVGELYEKGILDETIMDAGIGFRLNRTLPFWDLYLRLDIPFYVNQPAINGETQETDFRYVFSLRSVF